MKTTAESALPVYILAVSGGVDSMVLAETVGTMRTRTSIIAHFDHGIRKRSAQDEQFVRAYAERRGLTYVSERAELGPHASEEAARDARYDFLRRMKEKYNAAAIVTAHHQDDVLETMCINIIRGTGWRGLISLRSHQEITRPLLGISKAQLVEYALRQNIEWVEDRTNEDPRYLRNAIRQTVMRKMSAPQRKQLLELYHAQLQLGENIDEEIESLFLAVKGTEGLSRYFLTMVGESEGIELVQRHLPRRLERPQLSRLLLFAKTGRPGKKLAIAKGLSATVTDQELIVYTPET